MKQIWQSLKEKFVELYLYYIQGIEIGPRIERRVAKFQAKVQRMMAKAGITLIVTKNPDGSVSISFVPEKEFNEQKKMVDEMIQKEMLEGKGDPIGQKTS